MEKEEISFTVPSVNIMNEDGVAKAKIFPSNSLLKEMYELMILTRTFDEKAITLQRQGRIGTYASVKGQEAIQIGTAIQLQKEDLAFPAFREHGVYLTRGAPAEKLLQYWGGDEDGLYFDKNVNVFPVAITVGGHLPHAVGYAMAQKHFKKKSVAVVYFGDGATSEGDFHEALNIAGVFKSPVIFVCQNNQFAISTPVSKQTSSKTLAQKAIAYGIEGIQVDGNDILAVYETFKTALDKARAGNGPTLIEFLTYRLGDHTTSDDATRYRSEQEVTLWEKKDPLLRFTKFLKSKKIISESYEKSIKESSQKKIEKAVEQYEKMPRQNKEDIFKYTLSEKTEELKRQFASYMQEVE